MKWFSSIYSRKSFYLGHLDVEALKDQFGNSMELVSSANKILAEKIDSPHDLSSAVEEACKVASCGYEHNTSWGKKVRQIMTDVCST